MSSALTDMVNQYLNKSEKVKETKDLNRHCNSMPGKNVYCVQSGTESAWMVSEASPSNASNSCPPNSIPWRIQSICDSEPDKTSMCFTSDLVGSDGTKTEGGVCLVMPESEKVKISEHGEYLLTEPQIISNDLQASSSMIEQTMTPCYIESFPGIEGATKIVYVNKESHDKCNLLREDALSVCKLAMSDRPEECEKIVQDTYVEPHQAEFETFINTQKIPYLDVTKKEHYAKEDHYPYCDYDSFMKRYIKPWVDPKTGKKHCPDEKSVDVQWWRWKRTNEYPCKTGWMCDDSTLSEYKGGETCKKDKDCDTNIEHGICSESKVCKGGTNDGNKCSAHEDCDEDRKISGKCASTGVCVEGNTSIRASYYKPKACKPPKEGEAHLSYCGEINVNGETKYTGYCEAYRMPDTNKDSYACKAFLPGEKGDAEVADKQFSERDYQIGYLNSNFDANDTFIWQKLTTCPETHIKNVDGVQVCTATHDKIRLDPFVLEAESRQDAVQKRTEELCKDTVGPCPFEGALISKEPRSDELYEAPSRKPLQTKTEEKIKLPPPIPDDGLPEGWDMERWSRYGERYVEMKKNKST